MIWVRLGSVFMFLAVALGAFGAHALKHRLPPDMLAIFETGVRYQVYHALALFVVAWLSGMGHHGWVRAAGLAFSIGILIFSGSLYILTLSGERWWGAITPIGGVSFLIGWASLLISVRGLRP